MHCIWTLLLVGGLRAVVASDTQPSTSQLSAAQVAGKQAQIAPVQPVQATAMVRPVAKQPAAQGARTGAQAPPATGQPNCTVINEPYKDKKGTEDDDDDKYKSREERKLDEEKERAALVKILADNPKLTLWDLFVQRVRDKKAEIKNDTHPVEHTVDDTARVTGDIVKYTITDLAAATEYMIDWFTEPKSNWEKSTGFFKEMWAGLKMMAGLVVHEDPRYAWGQIGGGLFYEIVTNPGDFIAKTFLLIGGGTLAIHGLMGGLVAMAGTLPQGAAETLYSLLIFVHLIDDPIYILTPLLQTSAQTIGSIESGKASALGGATAGNRTLTMTLAPGASFGDRVPVLPTCKLPATSPAYRLTHAAFCRLTTQQLRLIIFGTDRDPATFTEAQTKEAYNKYQDFVCCYGPRNLTLPRLAGPASRADGLSVRDGVAQAVMRPTALQGCGKLLGHYAA